MKHKEDRQKIWKDKLGLLTSNRFKKSGLNIHVITPSLKDAVEIAKAVDNSNKEPKSTIFCVLQDDIPYKYETGSDGKTPFPVYLNHQFKYEDDDLEQLDNVGRLIDKNGAVYVKSLEQVAYWINNMTWPMAAPL